jgi:hypothetical protein
VLQSGLDVQTSVGQKEPHSAEQNGNHATDNLQDLSEASVAIAENRVANVAPERNGHGTSQDR